MRDRCVFGGALRPLIFPKCFNLVAFLVKAVSDSIRSGGSDAETIAAYERNMSRPGTVMTGAEI